ncbi:citramalate synthase [Kangiella shandongensis]|uniref:citramalate synthase n=1 Tax=Kangiella shandongensis TaxID=2763258 RepID=UPI001CBD4C3C|nr:citramalate synthase [Kangiella shandongensis]
MNKRLYLYDTTLRDGAQSKGISYSLDDKLTLTQKLDDFGFDYIEGGWPGSNPKDEAYFQRVKRLKLKHTKLVAFGSTRKPYIAVEHDPQVKALLDADTPVIAIVCKFWSYHVEKVLRTELSENLEMIYDTIRFLKQHRREVILDAEHFFDGFKHNREYVEQCIQVALNAGVDNVTLCDTNGGSMPQEIAAAVTSIRQQFPQLSLGIHCHNDCDMAVANSLLAVSSGASLIQGTVNGYGERCGNANLLSVLANLQLKSPYNDEFKLTSTIDSGRLTQLAHDVADITNIPLNNSAAFVGHHAFNHKGGIHVAAISEASDTYEHIAPELVGNHRQISISELSGKANIKLQAKKLGLDVSRNFQQVLSNIKSLEQTGLTLENAPGSFEMLLRKQEPSYQASFNILNIQIHTSDVVLAADKQTHPCIATVKLEVGNTVSHVAAEAPGPVDALNRALKKSLIGFYPQLKAMKLTDYKVSIINPQKASAATTRVWIQSGFNGHHWATIGCSDNIIQASTQALVDSYELFLIKYRHHSNAVDVPTNTDDNEETLNG